MNEEAERLRKIKAEVERAKRNTISVKTSSPATYTTGEGDEKHRLKDDFWKEKELWNDYEIPYLFLGYEPMSCDYAALHRIDSLFLNDREEELYSQYLNLIREAIDLGSLTPFKTTSHSISFRSGDIKVWRKTKSSIKPVQIYIDMEKEIQEPDTADNSTEGEMSGKAKKKDQKTQQPTITPPTQSKVYPAKDAIGRAMMMIAQAYADKGLIVTGDEMLNGLKKQLGATTKSSDNDYVSYTDTATKKRVKLNKANFGRRFTRTRKKIEIKQR